MEVFKVQAEVKNIYGNGENFIKTTYKADSLESAKKGFISYLQGNKNLVSFKNVIVKA